ncbi:MAG: hypothetical protein P9L92_02150 [Candidatus Electryonea clarkiae]|nr:hypothetical protein [Candidatus Electryonea clarkiae]MDP8287803.1 hypothetical protein [Candidatus Electryonea clarkiae]
MRLLCVVCSVLFMLSSIVIGETEISGDLETQTWDEVRKVVLMK